MIRGQEEKGTTEDEMAGWHHGLDGHESEWTPGDGDGQGGLECCDSWGRKESDTTELLNWTELNWSDVEVETPIRWLPDAKNWATSFSLFTFLHWRRKWQPTLVLLPGESQGRGSLVGCRLWGCTKLNKYVYFMIWYTHYHIFSPFFSLHCELHWLSLKC